MTVVDAVVFVVGVGGAGEHAGPEHALVLGLVTDIRGGRLDRRGLRAGERLLDFRAEHEGAVVAPGFELRHRGERGE
jgi:hypothetical protein